MKSAEIKKRLRLAIVLTFTLLCAEIAGGLWANSLALLSDAAHMFIDVLALSLSFFALVISELPTNSNKTYGYHRIEILAALINGIVLLLMAGGILWEAAERWQNPSEVNSTIVIWVALFGLCANLGVIYFLSGPVSHDHNHDLNIRSAFYHVLGDTIASVGVVIGGIVMLFTGWYFVDPLLATAISLLLIWGAFKLISESVHILLEGVPKGVSIAEVAKELTAIPEIKNIHELHIWCICSNIYALSTHALINDQKVNQVESILEEIRNRLKTRFNITHSTIQFESTPCDHQKIFCDIKH
jgi:cobalt-zinc-cadmium efflux system protein